MKYIMKHNFVRLSLMAMAILLVASIVSCNSSSGTVSGTVTSTDITKFQGLYRMFLDGEASNDDLSNLNLLLSKFLSSNDFASNIEVYIVDAIKSFKNKYPHITISSLSDLNIDSKEYLDLLSLLFTISSIHNEQIAIAQGAAQFTVTGKISPAISGGTIVATYSTSTSCAWWETRHKDVVKPDGNGKYTHTKWFGAWGWCQPQIKNYKIHWKYKYNNVTFNTGDQLVFSWQQGGNRIYQHDISLFSHKPDGIVPLGQPYIDGVGAILDVQITGKVVSGGLDYDVPVTANIMVLHRSYLSNLSCIVDWGDGTIDTLSCNSTNNAEVVSTSHKYARMGRYNVSVRLSDGRTTSNEAYIRSFTLTDYYTINFKNNGTDPVYGNTFNFDYKLVDELYEEPYTCSFSFYFVDPPSSTLLANFGPEPCPTSGHSPSVTLYSPGTIPGPGLFLEVHMVATNANNTVIKRTLQTSVLPPVRVWVSQLSVDPDEIAGSGTVRISFAGEVISYFSGARPNCELLIDNQLVYRSAGTGCIGLHTISRQFTNPRRYTTEHDITFKIDAAIDFGNGDVIRSEDSETVTLTVQPYAYVSGECYVQSKAGGPYDRKVSCTVNPSGRMLPGTYTFTASSAYVCPMLTRSVSPGDNLIRFNCKR
ncbi:hypothetical protein [Oceanithermus desulfurans]|uniref:PKD domain-containing protein n=2 Tax=Oceanithermus desulfurans TaxID=227924 RepID=A0A511RNY1_9DEIN|nr:hypothetical protein [Oceanithermus desulfurans]MBB6028987.1 hypothetical protein [Oceanithermus desulfurans]GEM90506.1 hypothetical protein ODE01S_19400 [Oceanithermus desulfurans NBRC 100063]